MNSKSPLRNSLWLLIAVMAFFAMAASSPQCAQSTQDRSFNPVFEPLVNQCIQDCQATFKAELRTIRMVFKAAKAACNGVPGCVEEASIIKDASVAERVVDKDACKAACDHAQGAATGGQ